MRVNKSMLLRMLGFACLLTFIGWGCFLAYSDEMVTVSAIVGSGNIPPQVLSTSPSVSPVVIAKNSIQTFSLKVQDTDSASVTYTVTAGTGATNPLSGTLSDASALAIGTASLDFTYFAPPVKAGTNNITVTLNDGTNVVVKNIGIYVY